MTFHKKCSELIPSFINDSALKLVTESNKFHIDWQRVNFCELDQLNNFIKYLYKTKTDSKQYFSKFFPYRGRVLAFCISVNTLYYEEHRNLFDNSFINFQGYTLNEYGSFLLTVINNFFSKWTDIYYYGLTETGTHLMTDYSIAALSANDITEGRNIPSIELYRDISSSRYEGAPCVGKLALFLCPENNEDKYEIIYFSKAIPLRKENTRLLRKLIELTKEKYYLVASCLNENQTEVVGLSSQEKCWKYEIIFNGYADFQILFCGNELIHVTGKRFYYTENQYVKQVEKVKDIIDKEVLSSLLDAASRQLHGTTLIIFKTSQRAREEASRLSYVNRGIELQKPECATSLIPLLSSIDGALILDADGFLYGFGVILDGKAYKGDTSRGARYNSAISYINDSSINGNKDCIAFVFSEDKTVDIVTPN